MKFETVTTAEGLALLGLADAKSGSVITSKRAGGVKRYAFKRRSPDLYTVRWGKLAGATVARQSDGTLLSVVFKVS